MPHRVQGTLRALKVQWVLKASRAQSVVQGVLKALKAQWAQRVQVALEAQMVESSGGRSAGQPATPRILFQKTQKTQQI